MALTKEQQEEALRQQVRQEKDTQQSFAGAKSFEDVGYILRNKYPEVNFQQFTNHDIGYAVLVLYPEYSDSIGLYANKYAYIDPALKATLQGIRNKNQEAALQKARESLSKKVESRQEQQQTLPASSSFDYGEIFWGGISLVVVLFVLYLVLKISKLFIKGYKKLDRALDIKEEKKEEKG